MNKRIVMALMAAVITASTFGTGTLTVNAPAPKTATVKVVDNTKAKQKALAAVFDAKYYAEKNPDVVAALGNDPKVLLTHYINSGIKEGRNASAIFNFDAYVSANPDLVAAFGTDDAAIAKYINHFATHAAKENRVATIEAATKMNIPVFRYGDNTIIINSAVLNPNVKSGTSNYVPNYTGSSNTSSSSGANYTTSNRGTSSSASEMNVTPAAESNASTPVSTPSNETGSHLSWHDDIADIVCN